MISLRMLSIVLMELSLILLAFVLPVVLVVKSFRLMLRNKNENIRLRLEVGKLADELELARKQGGDSLARSG
jgi:hypothetical protein